jgi:hypothetical protein
MAMNVNRFDSLGEDNRIRMSIDEIFGRDGEGRQLRLDAASRILSEGPCSLS